MMDVQVFERHMWSDTNQAALAPTACDSIGTSWASLNKMRHEVSPPLTAQRSYAWEWHLSEQWFRTLNYVLLDESAPFLADLSPRMEEKVAEPKSLASVWHLSWVQRRELCP